MTFLESCAEEMAILAGNARCKLGTPATPSLAAAGSGANGCRPDPIRSSPSR